MSLIEHHVSVGIEHHVSVGIEHLLRLSSTTIGDFLSYAHANVNSTMQLMESSSHLFLAMFGNFTCQLYVKLERVTTQVAKELEDVSCIIQAKVQHIQLFWENTPRVLIAQGFGFGGAVIASVFWIFFLVALHNAWKVRWETKNTEIKHLQDLQDIRDRSFNETLVKLLSYKMWLNKFDGFIGMVESMSPRGYAIRNLGEDRKDKEMWKLEASLPLAMENREKTVCALHFLREGFSLESAMSMLVGENKVRRYMESHFELVLLVPVSADAIPTEEGPPMTSHENATESTTGDDSVGF